MMNEIISSLKDKVGGDLMNKLGLDQQKADGAVREAGASMEDVVNKQKFDMSSMMGMLSGDGGAEGMTKELEQDYLGRLISKVGLDPAMAAKVKDMVLPALMGLIQSKGGEMLSSIMGDAQNGTEGGLAGKLGGLGKMFGK